jgi:hypothetical protein
MPTAGKPTPASRNAAVRLPSPPPTMRPSMSYSFQCLSRSLRIARLKKQPAARRPQYGARPLNDADHVLSLETAEAGVEQPVPAIEDTDRLDPFRETTPHDHSDAGIRARRVAARGDDAYRFHTHKETSSAKIHASAKTGSGGET